ncbi:hypothetical protein ACP70R_024434 [Stipagrostis hirtigluma subsp. patula]
MPRLGWDLNLDPDLQPLSRRLSYSESPSALLSGRREPTLPTIYEPRAAEAPASPSRSTAHPSPPGGTSGGAVYPAPGGMLHPTSAPVAPSLTFVPPVPSQSPRRRRQQQQQAATAARMSEQQLQAEARALLEYLRQRQAEPRALLEYQRQRQAAEAAQQQQAWAWAAAAARSQSQQLMLYTVDGGPAGYETKWGELHPVSQELLLQIEDKMREYKYESEHLTQCSRLHGPSLFNKSYELDACQIMQEAQSVSTIIDREKVSVQSLMAVVKKISRNTDFAIRSYVKLNANRSGSSGAHTYHCYTNAPRRPSPFVQHTVAKFEEHLGECCKWIVELEKLMQVTNDKTFQESLESIPVVMSNVHDYLIHVAAKVEDIHQYVETTKTRYLKDRRCRGDCTDPFLEADRRETAKQEATARIVHPTLHLLPPSKPTTPATAPTVASQLQQTLLPTVATFAPPSVLLPSSTQRNPAPLSNPFSSSSSLLPPTPFGSASTLTLGSTPATFCGTSTPSSPSSLSPTPYAGGTTASSVNRKPATVRKEAIVTWKEIVHVRTAEVVAMYFILLFGDHGCAMLSCDSSAAPCEISCDLDGGWGRCGEASARLPATTLGLLNVNVTCF